MLKCNLVIFIWRPLSRTEWEVDSCISTSIGHAFLRWIHPLECCAHENEFLLGFSFEYNLSIPRVFFHRQENSSVICKYCYALGKSRSGVLPCPWSEVERYLDLNILIIGSSSKYFVVIQPYTVAFFLNIIMCMRDCCHNSELVKVSLKLRRSSRTILF